MNIELVLWSAMGLALALTGAWAVVKRKITMSTGRNQRSLRRITVELRGGPAVLAGSGALVGGLGVLAGLARSASRPGGADPAAIPDFVVPVVAGAFVVAWIWQRARNLVTWFRDEKVSEKFSEKVEEVREETGSG